MKHSIRTKITLLLTTMVILTILFTWIINSTFLPQFYMQVKMDKLYEAYTKVAKIYESNAEFYLSEENTELIEQIEIKYDVQVFVYNNDFKTIFPIPVNIGKREKDRMEAMEKDFNGFNNPDWANKKLLKAEEDYTIVSSYDRQMSSSFIDLRGKLAVNTAASEDITGAAEDITGAVGVTEAPTEDITENAEVTEAPPEDITGNAEVTEAPTEDITGAAEVTEAPNEDITGAAEVTEAPQEDITGTAGDIKNKPGKYPDSTRDDASLKKAENNECFILLRSNTGSITESVEIANQFLAYVGIIAAIIGSIAMFLISKGFTKPILDLSGIAKKMIDLNFEVKYKVVTQDEIGELGSSINSLSDKLETTIVELKQANNELMTDIQRKTEIDEIRKEFLSNVSHELKTPIALIQGYAEGLKENINDDEENRDFYCEVIMDEANKMNNMVKKLLSLNELEFGNSQVNFDRFDIVTLIRSVLSATEILFKQKEVTLYFNQTEPIYVWADELLIEQVVTNYISNALNHVDGQNIIEIKLISIDNKIRVAVFNTGNNIPEDEIDKVWIKFYKVDKARTREYGGSGIGLSIVKAIMNSHNKECGAINRPIGVEFWFELDAKS